jgi:mono/diheme cytochrome c family protein
MRMAALALIGGSVLLWANSVSESWMNRVPATERQRVNPYAGNAEAAAAGGVLFAEHCAQCHGKNALGRRGPSLRSARIERATDGELAWILRNGYTRKGMPSWNALPELERWQLIAYLRSLPRADAARDKAMADDRVARGGP